MSVPRGSDRAPSILSTQQALRRWSEAVAADRQFLVDSRGAHFLVQLDCGADSLTLAIAPGQLSRVEQHGVVGAGRPLVLTGSVGAWSRFLSPVPPRFHTDVIGMQRRSEEFSVTGDTDLLQRHLRVLHRLFELARAAEAGDG